MTPLPSRSSADILGFEYDWLGADEDDFVALFSTAGAGYAPKRFLIDTKAHDIAIQALLALPQTTLAELAPELRPGYDNTWRRVAERGVYAYDCNPNGGPYRLVAAPAGPVRVRSFPAAVADAALAVRLTLRFVNNVVVTGELLGRSCQCDDTA